MSLRLIFNFALISGIFRKSYGDLDIFPPPPPFPNIENGSMDGNRKIGKETKNGGKNDLEKLGKSQIKDEKRKRRLEKEKLREKLKVKKREARRKGVFDFFHILGLAKTEQEKEEIEKQREESIKLKIISKSMGEEERKRSEKERQKKLELKRKRKEEKIISRGLKIPKTERIEEDIGKSKEIVEAEDEIQEAIEGIKGVKKKKSNFIKSLFKKREKPVEEIVEIPGIMPRTYDKIDGIELVEGKIHKARLALMDFKFDDAKRIYIETMKIYNDLDPKDKSRAYQDIKDLYYERMNAEKFAK